MKYGRKERGHHRGGKNKVLLQDASRFALMYIINDL